MKAYLMTGAYNPPTLAHEETTKIGIKNAISSGHTHFFHGFGGSSEVKDAPLSGKQKEEYMGSIHKAIRKDKSLSGINTSIIPSEHNDPFKHITHIIEKHGINDITIGLGSDQMQEGRGSLKSSIESHIRNNGGFVGSDKKTIHPVNIRFEQLGEPRVEQKLDRAEELRRVASGDLSVVKAGKIRERHRAGDVEYVRAMLPKGVNQQKLMKDLTAQDKKISDAEAKRKADILARREEKKAATAARNAAKKMKKKTVKKKLKEMFSSMLTERTASIQTRIKLSRAAKRTAKRRAIKRKIKSRTRYGLKTLKRRAYSQVKSTLRRRLFGNKSGKLSVAQRYQLDKAIDKRRPLLNRMVKTILPKVITGESKRLQSKNKRRLREDYSPFQSMLNNIHEEKTRQEKRRDQNDRKRKQRARDDASMQSNPFSGQVLIVQDTSNDDVMLIKASSYREDKHKVLYAPEKTTLGVAQNILGDENFVNTPTSISIFGKIENTETRSEPKETKQPEQQMPAVPMEAPTPVSVTSKKSSFPDSDHSATDLETGLVAAFNELKGIDINAQIENNLIGQKQAEKYSSSQTLSPAGKRAVAQLQVQLKKLFPNSDFVAIHYGSTKDQKLSKFWESQGGSDNTPKSDVLLKDRRSGQIIGASVKCEASQFMSGKAAGEATATVMTALDTMDKRALTPAIRKQTKQLLDNLKKLVVSDRTKAGEVGLYLAGGEREGQDKKILAYERLHKETKKMLEDLLSKSKEFKKALLLEAASGRVKFDTGKKNEISPAVAQFLISVNKDGTGASIHQINEELMDKIADNVDQIQIRMKSSSVGTAENQKKGKEKIYNYWSVMALGVGSKGLFRECFTYNKLLNELVSPEDTSTVFQLSSIFDQLNQEIDGDPAKLMQFLDVYPDEVYIPDTDLSDFLYTESGASNTVIINGREIEIPVQQDIDYDDTSIVDQMQQDTMDTEMMMQQKEHYISIALSFLTERTKYNKATGRDYKKEYKWQGTKEQKKRRAKRNKARRMLMRMGRVKKGDGKDVDHKNKNPHDNSKKNLRVVSKEHNRSIK